MTFIFLLLFAFYVPMVLLSHYISLSSVLAALFYPLILSTIANITSLHLPFGTDVLFAVAMGALITWAHRGNLRRIFDGNERKFYLHKKKAVVSTPAEPQVEEDAQEQSEKPSENE